MLIGKLLLLAISSMVVHSLSWFSMLNGKVEHSFDVVAVGL